MKNYYAMKSTRKARYTKSDTLVLFGELFQRGYANGLINEADKQGMKVIYSTVGRRDGTQLRNLTSEEVNNLPKPLINVALEAGFDMETGETKSPLDLLKDVKLDDWQTANLNINEIKLAQKKGRERFRKSTRDFFSHLNEQVADNSNVIISHLMAGGVPRAKIFMAVLNRVVKAKGDKFIPSEVFWNSNLGRLAALSFDEVTADTFEVLVEEAKPLIQRLKKGGGSLRFTAYGYHGTEILINDHYQWQSYAPYIQGWAKVRLENHSRKFFQDGISCCVYNCPEILTNSSSIFQGVEVPLYPLLSAFKKEGPSHPHTKNLFSRCHELLKPGRSIDDLLKVANDFYNDPLIKGTFNKFELWPQHNSLQQVQKLVDASNAIIEMHKDEKNLITFILSEEILTGTGNLIFNDSFSPQEPVAWLNHDIIVRQILSGT